MRSIDEQIFEIEKRRDSLVKTRVQNITAVSAFVCLALIAALSSFVIGIPGSEFDISGNLSYGSMLMTGPFISHFIVGFIAFLLGISFTMLCLHVNRRNRR